MKIWKLSHGKEHFNDSEVLFLRKNNLVSVHPNTPSKGISNIKQGVAFLNAEQFDLFYVCRSNDRVDLIGMFIDKRPLFSTIDNHEEWVDREYVVIKEALNPTIYNKNLDKWWMPKHISTFIQIPQHQINEFETEILQPAFNSSIKEILKTRQKIINEIKMKFHDVVDIQQYMERLLEDKDFAIQELNKITNIELRKLEWEYSNKGISIKNQPVVLLRKRIIEECLEVSNISENTINSLKDEIKQDFEKKVFKAWPTSRVLYPLFYSKYKENVIAYFDRFTSLVQKTLNIENFTKKTLVHFDGAQNQGSDELWFAIFNNSYPNQKHALQLYFSLRNKSCKFGLLDFQIKSNNDIVDKTNFNFREMISEFSKHIDKIKNDNFNNKAMVTNITDIFEFKNQIILQGPPGTGKTFTAKDIAELMIFGVISSDKEVQKKKLVDSDQFKLIQFHPAYSYEDFVRGIVAKTNKLVVEYVTENKTIAKFANEAYNNYSNSLKSLDEFTEVARFDFNYSRFVDYIQLKIEEEEYLKLSEKVFIDEVNDEVVFYGGKGGSIVGGHKIAHSVIKKAFLENLTEPDELKSQIKYLNINKQQAKYCSKIIYQFKEFIKNSESEFIHDKNGSQELRNFILIIDEINRANLPSVLGELIYALEYRGEEVESMYELEGAGKKLILPKNLFIIGTMNTADRSVGHIDYAIRRRFAFVDMLPDKRVIERVITDEDVRVKALQLFKSVSALFVKNYDEIDWANPKPVKSDYLSSDFKPEYVWIGHSYFLAQSNEELALKLNYEIKPILNEYVKDGVLLETAQELIDLLNIEE